MIPVCPPPLQREVVSSTRLAVIPPAFSTRTLPAQATEYAFAYIQIPQDVSANTHTHLSECSEIYFSLVSTAPSLTLRDAFQS